MAKDELSRRKKRLEVGATFRTPSTAVDFDTKAQ